MAETLPDLALVDAHVAQAERHVARQKEIIAELRLAGHSTRLAETLLNSFEDTLVTHLAHRDRLLAGGGRDEVNHLNPGPQIGG